MPYRFDTKYPDESVRLTFDFTVDLEALDAGVLLTGSPIVTVTVAQGTDPNPSAILNGSGVFDPTSMMVIVPVTAGLDQVDYSIRVKASTNDPLTVLELVGILPVRA